MAFSLKKNSKDPMSEINVTPFVDVMLVLLIIFMVTAPLLTVGVQVDLPESAADSLPDDQEPLTISINSKGEIYIQEHQVTYQKMIPKLLAIKSVEVVSEEPSCLNASIVNLYSLVTAGWNGTVPAISPVVLSMFIPGGSSLLVPSGFDFFTVKLIIP